MSSGPCPRPTPYPPRRTRIRAISTGGDAQAASPSSSPAPLGPPMPPGPLGSSGPPDPVGPPGTNGSRTALAPSAAVSATDLWADDHVIAPAQLGNGP